MNEEQIRKNEAEIQGLQTRLEESQNRIAMKMETAGYAMNSRYGMNSNFASLDAMGDYMVRVNQMQARLQAGEDLHPELMTRQDWEAYDHASRLQMVQKLKDEIYLLRRENAVGLARAAEGAPPVQEERRRFRFRDLFHRRRRAAPPPADPLLQPLDMLSSARFLQRELLTAEPRPRPAFMLRAAPAELYRRAQEGRGIDGSAGDRILAPFKPLLRNMNDHFADLVDQAERRGVDLSSLTRRAEEYRIEGRGSFRCSPESAQVLAAAIDLMNRYLQKPEYREYCAQFYLAQGRGMAGPIGRRWARRGRDPRRMEKDDVRAGLSDQAIRAMLSRGFSPFAGALERVAVQLGEARAFSPEAKALRKKRKALTELSKLFGKLELFSEAQQGAADLPDEVAALLRHYRDLRHTLAGAVSPEEMDPIAAAVRQEISGRDWKSAEPQPAVPAPPVQAVREEKEDPQAEEEARLEERVKEAEKEEKAAPDPDSLAANGMEDLFGGGPLSQPEVRYRKPAPNAYIHRASARIILPGQNDEESEENSDE